MVSGSEPKKRATTQGAGHLMTKKKKPKNSKRIFGQMCIAQKTTGSKTSNKTDCISTADAGISAKRHSSKYLKNSR